VLEQADVDVASATQVQQQIWSKGDFARVAPIVQVVADRLVESVDVLPGDRVLDDLLRERQHCDRRRALLRGGVGWR
jgi:hypothetical protein